MGQMKRCSQFSKQSVAIMKTLLLLTLALFLCVPAFAQQDIGVNRYTVYTGFDYFNSPGLRLSQRGFDTDFGVTLKSWVALGADFSSAGNAIAGGSGTINGSDTIYAPLLLAAQPLTGIAPSSVHVPFKSTDYTFAVGPQFYWRRWRSVTFLGRPGLGAIRATADVSLPAGLAGLLKQAGAPVPSAHQTDTQWFVGLGGGFDINASRRMALRVTADWINTHLYSNLLPNRQNFLRITVGPTFRWGSLRPQ